MRSQVLSACLLSLIFAVFCTAQDTPTPAQVKTYKIWPGDEVTAKVAGETDYDFVAGVGEDGMITIPYSQTRLDAKCRTEEEVKAELLQVLGKYLKNPALSFRVTDRKSRPAATISGEVNQPQQVILYRKISLLEMLSVAGGPKEEASGVVTVYRTQPPVCEEDKVNAWASDSGNPSAVPSKTFSLKAIKTGDPESNPTIYPGDNIIVQRAAPVYITGEVVYPQGVLIKDGGLTVYQAVAKIGGPLPKAKTKDIKIYRQKPDATFEVLSANFDLIRKGQQKDIFLKPYDVIEVSKAKDSVLSLVMKAALGAGRTLITSGANQIGYKVIY